MFVTVCDFLLRHCFYFFKLYTFVTNAAFSVQKWHFSVSGRLCIFRKSSIHCLSRYALAKQVEQIVILCVFDKICGDLLVNVNK